MHLDDFSKGRGLIHRIDPRTKLLILIPLIFYIALSYQMKFLLLSLTLAVLATLIFRLNLKELWRRLIPPNLFVLFFFIVLPFSVPGHEIFQIFGLSYSLEGFRKAISIAIKANTIVLFTILLLGTIPVYRLTHALRTLHVPDKLIQLFFFCYRYLTVLHDDYTSILNGMKARGFHPRSNVRTYRWLANLTGVLTIRSFDHSQKIYQAMLSRGFHGEFPALFENRFSLIDLCFISVFLLIFAIMLTV